MNNLNAILIAAESFLLVIGILLLIGRRHKKGSSPRRSRPRTTGTKWNWKVWEEVDFEKVTAEGTAKKTGWWAVGAICIGIVVLVGLLLFQVIGMFITPKVEYKDVVKQAHYLEEGIDHPHAFQKGVTYEWMKSAIDEDQYFAPVDSNTTIRLYCQAKKDTSSSWVRIVSRDRNGDLSSEDEYYNYKGYSGPHTVKLLNTSTIVVLYRQK